MLRYQQKQSRSWCTFSLLIVGLAALTACAGGTFGNLKRNQTALQNFLQSRVLPGHRYYTTGVPNSPDAIVAISDAYTLVSDRWQERKMDDKLLGRLVVQMHQEVGVAKSIGLAGSVIYDDQGGRIGEWYSFVSLTTVRMLGDNKVVVSPPAKAQLEKERPRDRGR